MVIKSINSSPIGKIWWRKNPQITESVRKGNIGFVHTVGLGLGVKI